MNDSKFLSLNGLIYYDEKLKSRIKELYGSDMTVEWEEIKNGKNPFKLKNHLKELYGSDMTVEWQEIKDGKNPFKLKIALKNGNGTELFAKTVDFPLEQTIVSGSYENSTKYLILYFQDGTSTKIPIKDLIEGLASKLDLDKKANLGVKTTDSNTAHIRDIPENALPYAGISKIGGVTRKCTNMLPYPYLSNGRTDRDVVWKVNTDGTVVANGTANGGNSTLELHNPISLPQGDYHIYANDGNKLPLGCAMVVYKNGAYIGEANDVFSISVTSNDRLRIYLQVATGITVNNAIFKPMIAKSIIPYEPYYKGLRDTKVTAVKSVGRNLFDLSKAKADTGRIEIRKDSILWEYPVSNQDLFAFQIIVDVIPNTTYSLNWKATSINRVFVYTDVLWGNNLANIQKGDSFNSGKNERLVLGFYSSNSNRTGASEIISDIILNKGTSVLPYSPYTEHTLEIPEAVQSLEGYGLGADNTHYNFIDFEGKKFNRVVGKVDLNTLIWGYSDADKRFYTTAISFKTVTNNIKPNLICANYTGVSFNDFYSKPDVDKTISTTGQYLFIRDLSYTDVSTFVSTLKGVSLVYALATPTAEDISNLTTSDNLIGVEGGGTVTLVNEYGYDVPCDIDFFTGDNKIVSSSVFVGDLMGEASFAKYFDVDGSPSEKTIAEALEDVTREDSPIKVTSTSIGQKATEGLELTVSTDVLANPPAEIGDIVIDAYTDDENLSYINLWEITGFDAGYSTMRIVGINSVNTGGGSASFAQKAEADGNGNNIAGTYATKQALKALEDSANGSIHNIEAAIDGVEANGQALAERLDSLNIVNGAVAKAVTATNAESAKAGSGLDISIRDASVNASDALTKATNALASAAENHTIIQNFPNTYAKISDLSDYSLLTESGNSVSVSWEPPVNGVNPYKLNIKLINAKGNEISSAQIDFPLEQMVVGAEYTESTKELVLETLEGTVKVPVSDIFRGLITESNIGNQTVAKASLATKATNDGQGNDIVQTYATNSNLSALENRVDNLDSDGQALADKFDSLGAVNGVVAKAVTATNAESAKAGSGLDNDITQARKDASDALAKANSVLSLVNENKFQLEAIFNEDAPATVQKAKYAETAGSADYASRCRDSNGNPLLISNIVTKADAAELLASQANSASKSAIVSARCEYIKSSYQASVGTLNLYLKTADNREIAVTDFQEALMSLLEDFMS